MTVPKRCKICASEHSKLFIYEQFSEREHKMKTGMLCIHCLGDYLLSYILSHLGEFANTRLSKRVTLGKMERGEKL